MCKRIFAIFFLAAILGVFACAVGSCCLDGTLGELLKEDTQAVLEDHFPLKSGLRELYGASNLVLSPHEIASETNVIIKDEDGFLTQVVDSDFDIGAAEEKVLQLRDVCQKSSAQFLYVSYPSKASYQPSFAQYGLEGNNYAMRKEFLAGLEQAEVPVLNVGDLMQQDGFSIKEMFYKTDHHWKAPMGLYAANAIVGYLNESFGYSLNQQALQEDQFHYTTYPDLWLGETGRSCSETWVGTLDDFVEIQPKYDTSFVIGTYGTDEKREGDFSLFIDDSGYGKTKDLYTYSAHYSYQGDEFLTAIHNNNAPEKKILLVKDSFSIVVIPFLALTTSDLVVWDARSAPENNASLYDFIQNNDFDLVMMAYTDYWQPYMYNFS